VHLFFTKVKDEGNGMDENQVVLTGLQRLRAKRNGGALKHWKDVLKGKGIFDKLCDYVSRTVRFPNHEFQSKVLVATALMPHTPEWAEFAPIVIIDGQSDCGKSTAFGVFNIVQGDPHDACIATCTANGMRNEIDEKLFGGDGNPVIVGSVIFDNVYAATFDDEKLRKIFLNGYRKGAFDTVAGKEGGSIRREIFGLKVLTTVDNFWVKSNLNEITSRSIRIKTQKLAKLSDLDKGSFTGRNKLKANQIDWTGLESEIVLNYQEENLGRWDEADEFMSCFHDIYQGRRIEIMTAPFCAMYQFSNLSLEECKYIWVEYWKSIDSNDTSKLQLSAILESWIAENWLIKPSEIEAKSVTKMLKAKRDDGEISGHLNVDSAMDAIGYQRTKLEGKSTVVWRYKVENG
jgi:hypothetical protein